MQSKLASWCDGLIEAGILAAVIVAPLFFNIHSDRVFEPDKLTLVRSISVLMAGAWLVGFVDRQGWQDLSWLRWRSEDSVWRIPFVAPVFLLVVVYLLSTAFSVVPRTSWAGSYQRLQGTYTTLSYIVIFALAAHTLRRREQVNRIVTTVIVTSIPISLYGLLQHYGWDPLPWGGNVQDRIAGHMGNAIFIAAYLIMAVPLTAVRIVDAFTNILNDEELSYADVVRSSVYIFTIVIQLVAIYWSGSRGPMLGLLIGMFALILILLVSLRNAVTDRRRFGASDFGRALALVVVGMAVSGGLIYLVLRLMTANGSFSAFAGSATSLFALAGAMGVVALAIFVMLALRRGWRWLWLSWLLLTLVGILWLAVFNLTPEFDAEHPAPPTLVGAVQETINEWRELPTVGRFGRLLEAERGTGRVRVLIWEGALNLILPHEPLAFPDGEVDTFNFLRPLIGYGPESMYVAYNRFYVPELATIEARNASPDRSHNETFDALIITGLAGFLVWQALYLSVFYYAFHWLGVVRTTRDRNLLIGFWIAGAIVGALLIMQFLGAVYVGVAIPFGSIAGLALYLTYYALFGSSADEKADVDDPFQIDRLLMMGLVAAVVAHYVEIHFGIAIAATRVHFFVYVALMLLVGYVQPRLRQQNEDPAPVRSRRAPRRRLAASQNDWLAPVLGATFALALICGTLFYEYMNYTQQPGVTIETLADVPSVYDLLYQAYFIHPAQGFIESPYIFLLIILSWALGTLAYLSEMVRQDVITLSPSTRSASVRNSAPLAGGIFIALVLIAFATRFIQPGPVAQSATQILGQGLAVIWGALCLLAAFMLFRRHQHASAVAGFVALTGIALSIPTMFAGATLVGLSMLIGCGAVAYFLWAGSWSALGAPGLLIALGSILVALVLAYFHANQIRTTVFFGPPQTMPVMERLIFSANRFASFITVYYVYVIALLILAALGLQQVRAAQARSRTPMASFAALAITLALCLIVIRSSNMRVIQADIVYKQGRPLDSQATRAGNPDAWNAPIALYERAIELAPLEDFYYLFLGRAYLERSAVTSDPAVQQMLLQTAKERLLEAQEINPLNTDHTANLARLSTRWTSLTNIDDSRRGELLTDAKSYYQDALALSPQNSVIRNEYGNLLATLERNCSEAIDTLQHSLAVDPYYVQSYYTLASIYEFCAGQENVADPDSYYLSGAQTLEDSLEVNDSNAGSVYLQIAQLYRSAEEYDSALDALEQASTVTSGALPPYLVDYQRARVYEAMGDIESARELAEAALATAPPESQEEIQNFIDGLGTP